jgi:hypothetical protein
MSKESRKLKPEQRKAFREEAKAFDNKDVLHDQITSTPGTSEVGIQTRRADPKIPANKVIAHGYARVFSDPTRHRDIARNYHRHILNKLRQQPKPALKSELQKNEHHKYIKKIWKNGKWNYIYHEHGSVPRSMHEDEIKDLKTKADSGHEESKVLHDTIENNTEGEIRHTGSKPEAELPKGDTAVIEGKENPKEAEPQDVKPEITKEPEKKKRTRKPKLKANPVETPRKEAEKETEEMEATEYANDRSSKIGMRGEDVMGSARHKALDWKTVAHALESQDAEEMFTRDFLEVQEPIDFISKVTPTNIYPQLVGYFSMRKFPVKPPIRLEDANKDGLFMYQGEKLVSKYTIPQGETKFLTKEEHLKKQRQNYYDAYKTIKDIVTEAVTAPSATDVKAKIGAKLREAYHAKVKDVGQMDTGAESLRQAYNSIVSRGSTSPIGQATNFAKMAKEALVGEEEKPYAEAEAAKKVLEGKSINAAFGKAKKKTKGIDAKDAYDTSVMTRKGPPSKFKNVKQALDMLDKNVGGAFEMRAVQWGKSVTDEERQHHLKSVVDSMADLCDILGLPEKMASFNGKLALAIGARGKAGALAHYEPGKVIINLTRSAGAGSLAHEWGHFFDNIIGQLNNSNWASDIAEADVNYNFPEKKPLEAEFTEIYKHASWQAFETRIVDALHKKGVSHSEKQYWSSAKEMFARAFERHIQHKLAKNGRENTYLVALRKNSDQPESLWPIESEIKELSPLFDKLFEAFVKSDHLNKAIKLINNLQKNEAADKETAVIKENKKGKEAQTKHKFKAAKWTHPNGHPRCFICGDEERIDGYCEGIDMKKAEKPLNMKTIQKPEPMPINYRNWHFHGDKPSGLVHFKKGGSTITVKPHPAKIARYEIWHDGHHKASVDGFSNVTKKVTGYIDSLEKPQVFNKNPIVKEEVSAAVKVANSIRGALGGGNPPPAPVGDTNVQKSDKSPNSLNKKEKA